MSDVTRQYNPVTPIAGVNQTGTTAPTVADAAAVTALQKASVNFDNLTPAQAQDIVQALAQYSGVVIPKTWSKQMNVKFYASTLLTKIANTNWQGEIKTGTDTVFIRTAPTVAIDRYKIGGHMRTQMPVPTMQELKITELLSFQLKLHDVHDQQSDMDQMAQWAKDAAMQMAIRVEEECFFKWFTRGGEGGDFLEYGSDLNIYGTGAGAISRADATFGDYTDNESARATKNLAEKAEEDTLNSANRISQYNAGANAGKKSGAYNMGTDVNPIARTSATNSGEVTPLVKAIINAAAVLEEQNVNDENRFMLCSALDIATLMQSNLWQAEKTGDGTTMIRNKAVGKIAGFDVYQSNLLPHAAQNRKWVGGQQNRNAAKVASDGTPDTDAGRSKNRHLALLGTKDGLTYASQITDTESFRDTEDFGEKMRGLNVFGCDVVKGECLVPLIIEG